MRSARRAMAAGAGLLAIVMLFSAGVLAGCGDEGTHTSAAPAATASSAPTVTSASLTEAGTKPAVSYSQPPFGGGMNGFSSFTLGWRFRPTLDIEVTDLGYVDPSRDGLNLQHRVGIFDAETDRLVVSVTVGPKSALDGFFRWESLEAPVVLRAGHPYLAAAVWMDGDEVRDGAEVWAPEVGHRLTSVGKHFMSSTASDDLSAPHQEADWLGFMAPNFKFRSVSAASPTL